MTNRVVIVKNIEAIDIFCGVGGLTCGLRESGILVLAGLDNDPSCFSSYTKNNDSKFIQANVAEYDFQAMKGMYSRDSVRLLVGCAPCQPFSLLTRGIKVKCERWGLLNHFLRAVETLNPHIISVENVAGIIEEDVFKKFVEQLERNGYYVTFEIINCANYGIPQHRKRMLLLASLFGNIAIPKETHSAEKYITVRETIGKLPQITNGEKCKSDSMHRSRKLSATNLKRIQQSRPGGTWREWRKSLQLDCHKKESGKGYTSVYGRMEWDKPSPTITTQFSTYGCGRFGHPKQDRAISAREAALLQTFSGAYTFEDDLGMSALGRQIGNAVPPKIGLAIGKTVKQHVGEVK